MVCNRVNGLVSQWHTRSNAAGKKTDRASRGAERNDSHRQARQDDKGLRSLLSETPKPDRDNLPSSPSRPDDISAWNYVKRGFARHAAIDDDTSSWAQVTRWQCILFTDEKRLYLPWRHYQAVVHYVSISVYSQCANIFSRRIITIMFAIEIQLSRI